ncbi:MAG: PD-(D/E)XK nuclease family protein [Halochromatium sp.]|uniref:PD-(D/E)XK nuclease family protein n=1 Tax=Halochromatium sp. TaxID=2049430 RepID=UPI00397A69EA
MQQEENLKEHVKRELPKWLRADPAFRRAVLDITRDEFADKGQTEGRIEAMLAELARNREEQARKWDEQREEDRRKWDEQREEDRRKWQAQEALWAESRQKWDAQQQKWDEQQRKWEEQQRKWEEQQRKSEEETRAWREHEKAVWAEFDRLHEENRERDKRVERSIGALGARWGLQSERAFRDALAGILEKSFGVEVLNVNEYDDEGLVFGRPDQVELDFIIKNGLLIICELKSSIDKAGMYSFERKARFYEKRHGRTASRLIVVSPMIDARAQKVAEKLGIETFGDSLDVETL